MTAINRTSSSIAFALIVGAIACSNSTGTGRADQEITAEPAPNCSAEPPINAYCAPCANGYRIESGEVSCACCTPSDGDAGVSAPPRPEPCCDPATQPAPQSPEGVVCCADGRWKQSLGGSAAHTCQDNGGPGDICTAGATGEVCGGPPVNAFCAECPGGLTGYKQIDGQPTCDCCTLP